MDETRPGPDWKACLVCKGSLAGSKGGRYGPWGATHWPDECPAMKPGETAPALGPQDYARG